MNWKEEAKKELRQYPAMRESLRTVADRIEFLEAQKTSVKSSIAGGGGHGGELNPYEDKLVSLIAETERLKVTLEANRTRVELIERGLAVLDEQERFIALTFAGHRSGEAVEILSAELCLEQAQIYRLWSAVLHKFTLAEYGIPEF